MPVPKQTPVKRYRCDIWPYYRIRDLRFEKGILDVFSMKDAKLVESTDHFGGLIVEVPVDEEARPVQDEIAHQGTMTTQTGPVEETSEPTEVSPITPDDLFDDDDNSDSAFPKPAWPQDQPGTAPPGDGEGLQVLGGGHYIYNGVKYRGKDTLPPEARALV